MEIVTSNSGSVYYSSKPENSVVKFWHEIKDSEIETLLKRKVSWDYISRNYKKPEWCSHGDALNDIDGCLELSDLETRKNICLESCKSCPLFKPTDKNLLELKELETDETDETDEEE